MKRVLVRIFSLIAVLVVVFIASRAIVRGLPGDPITTLMAETGSTLSADALREELGLDRPFFPALILDAKQALRGDFGNSILSRQPVGPILAERFLNTLKLSALAIGLGLVISVLLGTAAASAATGDGLRFSRIADRICTAHGAFTAALPTPWIGPMLIYVLAVVFPVFPLGGSIQLPALTLALVFSGFWARLIRERVRETLRFGSSQGARARGISEWKILLKYGLAPSSGALVAYLGTQFGAFLGGAAVTEVIFDYPGLGTLLVESVLGRDYPVVEASVFAAGSAALIGTALGDLAQYWVDPRSGVS